MSEPTMSTDEIPGLAPWVESIQAIKDDRDESQHVLTVLGMALLETLASTPSVGPGIKTCISQDCEPFLFHAYEVLAYHGLISLRMNEAPGWWDVAQTDACRELLARAQHDRAADIANREGQMR